MIKNSMLGKIFWVLVDVDLHYYEIADEKMRMNPKDEKMIVVFTWNLKVPTFICKLPKYSFYVDGIFGIPWAYMRWKFVETHI